MNETRVILTWVVFVAQLTVTPNNNKYYYNTLFQPKENQVNLILFEIYYTIFWGDFDTCCSHALCTFKKIFSTSIILKSYRFRWYLCSIESKKLSQLHVYIYFCEVFRESMIQFIWPRNLRQCNTKCVHHGKSLSRKIQIRNSTEHI